MFSIYGEMTKEEILDKNRLGLIEEYKKLNKMMVNGCDYSMEVSFRMSDIALILMDKYNMAPSEIEALEAIEA